MAARLRLATAIVLGVAALFVLGFGIYLVAMRDAYATADELRSWSAVHVALFKFAHNRSPLLIAGAVIGVGLVALGLVAVLLRSRLRWPLLLIAVASIGVIALAQWSRGDIERSEPRGYRDRSTYVQAARWLASAVTIYLVVLALLAVVGWWLSRPAPGKAEPALPASPA